MSYLEAVKNFFGRPEQTYVQENSWESLKETVAMAIKEKLITVEQSLQLLAARKKMESDSREFEKRIEKSIVLDSKESRSVEPAQVHEVRVPEKEERNKVVQDRTRDE